MKKIDLPHTIVKVLSILNNAGYEGYVVGGAIRDSFLNIEPTDFDIATNASIEEMQSLFNNLKVTNKELKHNTLLLCFSDMNIEITSYRDKEKTLKGDLLLRDFTINSLAYSKETGIIDYNNGIEDIKNKTIRLNGNDDSRFIEDPIRILRAIRLSGMLKFDIDKKTINYMFANAHLINDMSKERINDEFTKILLLDKPSLYLRKYFDIFTSFIPELEPLKGFDQNTPYHIYDCLEHTLVVVDNVEKDKVLRLAALFHDSGKPHSYTEDENGIGHFYGHYKISVDIAKKVLTRLKYDNNNIKKVLKLIKFHDYPLTLSEKSLKKLIHKFGQSEIYILLELKKADNLGQNPNYRNRLNEIEEARLMIEKIIIGDNCFSIKDLKINGKDLIKIGIKEGKEIGYILNQLLNLVINNEISNNYDDLIEKAIELKKEKDDYK